jgi:hypothetical protein
MRICLREPTRRSAAAVPTLLVLGFVVEFPARAQPMIDLAPLRHAFRDPDRVSALADRMFVGFGLVPLDGAMVVMAWFVDAWFLTH